MRRTDPRIRQTLNQISQTVESAQYSTQASLFSFTQNYLTPCFASISSCLEASCHPCYQCLTSRSSDPHHGRKRHPNRRRGREELSFDFYDDWEEDEREWGNDELDRLLAGNEQDNSGQPSRKRGMSYGGIVSRRKTMSIVSHHHNAKDAAADANIVLSSSMFGFLERLPWKIGGRGRRYRPSAADLQDVGEGTRSRKPTTYHGEDELLISESEDEAAAAAGARLGAHKQQHHHHGRNRSTTMSSRETTTSLSSRGDLFPSEDEDDAVPLDDEFTIALERRPTTGTTSDEHSKRGAGGSRASTKTKSSADTRSSKKRRGTSAERERGEQPSTSPPSMTDLKEEEERVRIAEEAEVERGREAAQRLARERGLSGSQQHKNPTPQPPSQPNDSEPKDDAEVSVHPVSSSDEVPAGTEVEAEAGSPRISAPRPSEGPKAPE